MTEGREAGEQTKIRSVSLPDRDMGEVIDRARNENEPLSREDAARIFLEIADYGSSGRWPMNIMPREVGRALYRLMSNNGAPDEFNLSELELGFKGKDNRPLVEE